MITGRWSESRMARDGGGEVAGAGAGAGVGIDFLGYELLPSCLLSYHIREASERPPTHARRLHTHVRDRRRMHSRARARTHMHTYTRGFARGTHRLRVGLATGVEIIPDCLEVDSFFPFYEFNMYGFRRKETF